MPHSLIWLPDVLLTAGLRVATEPGWENRGRGDVGNIVGVICHHTAGPKTGILPSLRTLVNGRPARPARPGHKAVKALPGPLAQLGLGRDGSYIVIAAGRCNHAGEGSWKGVTAGNTRFIGIEAENTGLDDDSWPDVQMDAYRRGVAAILTHIGRGAEFCAGHKEYALPEGRKPDPTFEMDDFRSAVASIMSGGVPAPKPIPVAEPPAKPGAPAGRPTLRRGANRDLVKEVQAKVGVTTNGNFGPKTEAALRAFQRAKGLVPDGIVGPQTWAALDAA